MIKFLISAKEKQAAAEQTFVFLAQLTGKQPANQAGLRMQTLSAESMRAKNCYAVLSSVYERRGK